jgi:hypothetical protein
MSERKLIREFISRANLDACLMCGASNCNCMANVLSSYDQPQDHNSQHGHHDLDPDNDGHVTPDDLYSHFDANNDGKVTTQDYVNHVDFHCAHPESMDHYRQARQQSIQNVPCTTSYDTCSKHLMGDEDSIDIYLKPLMDQAGSTCKASSTRAFIDVLQSLLDCGVLG